MQEKKSENTYKNRHVEHKSKEMPCNFVFPDADFCKERFCDVNVILSLFVPVKKKEEAE